MQLFLSPEYYKLPKTYGKIIWDKIIKKKVGVQRFKVAFPLLLFTNPEPLNPEPMNGYTGFIRQTYGGLISCLSLAQTENAERLFQDFGSDI